MPHSLALSIVAELPNSKSPLIAENTLHSGRPRLSVDTIALIQQMAKENSLWGTERIRGELFKLGLSAVKHTIQKYTARVRPAKPASQT